jgi:tRNA-specific 2-thiouridylase
VELGDEEDLDRSEMRVSGINMMKYDSITPGMEALTKIRYRDSGCLSNLYPGKEGVDVRFFNHVKGIAPGQSAVFYQGSDLIGGGIIQKDE